MMASSTNTPGPDGVGTPDHSQAVGGAGDSSMTAGGDDGEPPLKRARSSSGLLDAEGEGTPGPGTAGLGSVIFSTGFLCLLSTT